MLIEVIELHYLYTVFENKILYYQLCRWKMSRDKSKNAGLKYFRLKNIFSVVTFLLISATDARGQDVYYAAVQDMNIWYNPALKTNKISLLHANFRSVSYQGITSYSSKAATIELPLISRDKKDDENAGFFNLAAGINADDAGNEIFNVSTGMLSLSYALPLNYNQTFLALGFQGAYTFSKISYSGTFPEQFDRYGAIGAAVSADPVQSGYEYIYFNAAAGIALFHNGADKQWYIGASLRHLNQPYTDWTYSTRLPMNRGIQLGYTSAITSDDVVSGYAIFDWQGPLHEQLVGAVYTRNLDDSVRYNFSLGIGYRVGDALIPNLGFKIGENHFAFYYEFILSNSSLNTYNRTAFEFSYTLNL